MSKLKLTASILLASLITVGSVNAVEDNKEKPKTSQKQTRSANTDKKSAKKETKENNSKDVKNLKEDNTAKKSNDKEQTAKAAPNPLLKDFSNAVGITYTGGELGQDAQGQQYFVLGYTIENKSKDAMKSVHWTTAFVNNQKPIFAKNVDVPFPAPLKAKEKININVQIAFSEMPQEIVKLLLDEKQKSDIIVIARELEYVNGKKITVQQ